MKVLTVSHIKVSNANGVSSAITVGLPAIPAVLGMVRNLERHLDGVRFPKTAIVVHSCSCIGRECFYKSARVTKPVIAKLPPKSNGEARALEDNVRSNLDISLVLQVEGPDFERKEILDSFPDIVRGQLMNLYLAGGSITGIGKMFVSDTSSDKRIFKKLCPGYVLVSARNEFKNLLEDGQDPLEMLVRCCGINVEEEVYSRKLSGWKIPISTGFRPITEPEMRDDARSDVPHVFGEALITLGECIFVTKVNDIENVFWQYGQDKIMFECVCDTEKE